ncbi:MFS transporter [Angustibacter luteus]|uniref:MFS transporter n=1 Tax=Angustibacter luteus TaxID=658456 RepID=A0ABW1J9R8_9ACTN
MRAIWRLLVEHRDYRALLAAGLVSRTGDYVLTVGLMYLVYDLTGSTVATAGMLVVSVVPQMLLASPAGVLVDRWDRRRVLVVTLVAHAVTLLPLLAVHGGGTLWLLYAVAGVQAVLELLSVPAEQALVPLLVPPERLVSANALNAQAGSVARLVGAGLGGVAAAWGGIVAVTLVDVASFVAAATLVVLVRGAGRGNPVALTEEVVGGVPWWHEWRAGLRIAAGSRTLRILLAFTVVTAVGEGIMGTLFAPFVLDVLHGGPQGYGLVVGVQAIGGIAGGLLVAGYGDRLRPARLFGWGAAVFGLVDLSLFLYPIAWAHVGPAVVLMIVVGLPGAAVVAGATTLLQHATLDAHRGRVLGTVLALQSAGMLVGAAAAGLLPTLVGGTAGIIAVIAWQGVGYLLFGVLASTVWVPDDQPRPDDEASAAAEQREEHRVGAVPVRPQLDGPGALER